MKWEEKVGGVRRRGERERRVERQVKMVFRDPHFDCGIPLVSMITPSFSSCVCVNL